MRPETAARIIAIDARLSEAARRNGAITHCIEEIDAAAAEPTFWREP